MNLANDSFNFDEHCTELPTLHWVKIAYTENMFSIKLKLH